MQKHVLAIIVGLGLTASAVYLLVAKPVVAAQSEQSSAVFNADGTLQLPDPHVFSKVDLCCVPWGRSACTVC